MSTFPHSREQLAESIAAFAEKITPARARWAYCFSKASYIDDSPRFGRRVVLSARTLPVCDRIAGGRNGGAKFRLEKIRKLGLDGAFEWDANYDHIATKPWFWVGPMQAWNVGHLYFARVVSHPHVVKIGFSRRVRERFEDIETKVKAKLVTCADDICAGTLADEHWWHNNWSKTNISGEWFFDPHMTDRSLPEFLKSDALPARRPAAGYSSSRDPAANGGAVVPGGSSTLYTRPALSAVPDGEPSVPSSDDGGAKMEGGLHPHPGRTDDMSGHKDAQSEQATVSSINQHGRSAA